MKIYILKLKDNCWYIGKTDQENRIQQHFKGNGSEWTKLHTPISVEKVIENCDEFDEDKYVKIYMIKYGIENVRGGTYSFRYLDTQTKIFLNRELNHAKNCCFLCRQNGHLSSNCHLRKKKSKVVMKICKNCGQTGHTFTDCYHKEVGLCYKCNKPGHDPNFCFSKKDFR